MRMRGLYRVFEIQGRAYGYPALALCCSRNPFQSHSDHPFAPGYLGNTEHRLRGFIQLFGFSGHSGKRVKAGALFAGCLVLQFLPTATYAAQPSPLQFEQVIDADTFTASGHLIRLGGIHGVASSDPRSYAAKLLLESILKSGKLSCSAVEDPAALPQIMRCQVDNNDVASMLVRTGMATSSDLHYAFEENKAKKEGRGIWKVKK